MEGRHDHRHRPRLLTRYLPGAAVLSCWLAITAPTASAVSADEPQEGNQGPTFAVVDTGVGVGVDTPGTAGHGGGSGASRRRCHLEADTGNHSSGSPAWEADDPHIGEQGGWFFLLCDHQIIDVVWLDFTVGPAGRPAAATLAQQVWRFLPVPRPEVRTNPPNRTVVGLTTWFWTAHDDLDTRTVHVAVPGFGVTVRARAVSSVWEYGDGTVRTCAEPSLAYHPGQSAQAAGACTHRYERSSAPLSGQRFRGRATTVWRIDWSASDGSGGSLPDLRRSSGFDIPVAEVQTLIVPSS